MHPACKQVVSKIIIDRWEIDIIIAGYRVMKYNHYSIIEYGKLTSDINFVAFSLIIKFT